MEGGLLFTAQGVFKERMEILILNVFITTFYGLQKVTSSVQGKGGLEYSENQGELFHLSLSRK